MVLVILAVVQSVPLLAATAVIQGVGNTLFSVALRSAVPDVTGQEDRNWANAFLVTSRSLATVAGFLSAGLIVPSLGYAAAFLLDAGSFVVCAATVACLPLPKRAGPNRTEPAGATGKGRWLGREGAAGRIGGLLTAMIALRALDALGSSAHNTGLPIYSALLDPAHPAAFASRFLAAWAVGCVVVQRILRSRGGVGAGGFVLGTVLMSVSFVLGFAGLPTGVALAVGVVAGCADGLTETSYANHLQALPSGTRDHAFGLSATVENIGFGAGTMITAALLDQYTPTVVVAVSHSVVVAAALVFLIGQRFVKEARHVDAAYRDHRDGVPLSRR